MGHIEVNLSALRHNFASVRAFVETRCCILPIVKSDAYGHGIVPAARALLTAGADRLGLATVEEGMALRESGVGRPLVILGATGEDHAPDVVRHGLTPVVFRLGAAEALNRAAKATGRLIPVHVKIDTGMGRLGLDPSEAPAFIEDLSRLDGLRIEGVMTHFADADPSGVRAGGGQVARFEAIRHQLDASGGRLVSTLTWHAANSAAIIGLPGGLPGGSPGAWFDMVRPGLLLYGCYPSPKCPRPLDLRPVMTVKSRIVHLRRLAAGSGAGYDHTFIARRESLIAIVPIGYSHGYSRALSNRGQVEIRGRRAPVVGSVCMDMTMVDVTEIEGVALEDEVILLGGGTAPTAEDLAEAAGTIPHEVLCALGSRLPRVYTA